MVRDTKRSARHERVWSEIRRFLGSTARSGRNRRTLRVAIKIPHKSVAVSRQVFCCSFARSFLPVVLALTNVVCAGLTSHQSFKICFQHLQVRQPLCSMAAAPPSPLDEPAIDAGTVPQQLKEHVPVNTTFHFDILDSAACPDLSVVKLATDGRRNFEEHPPKTKTTNSAPRNSTSSAAHPDAPTCERLHLRYQPRPVEDVAKYNAFPAAARQREVVKAATKFAGNARNIFVHYTEPIL